MDLKIKWMAIFNLTQKEGDSMSFKMSRKQYADLYGPTTGDSIRLADTQLFAHIERNATVYGDEAVFGGGKSIRMVWDKIHNLQGNRGCGCCYYECNYY